MNTTISPSHGPFFTRSTGEHSTSPCNNFLLGHAPGVGSLSWAAQVSVHSFSNVATMTLMLAPHVAPQMKKPLMHSRAQTLRRPTRPRPSAPPLQCNTHLDVFWLIPKLLVQARASTPICLHRHLAAVRSSLHSQAAIGWTNSSLVDGVPNGFAFKNGAAAALAAKNWLSVGLRQPLKRSSRDSGTFAISATNAFVDGAARQQPTNMLA